MGCASRGSNFFMATRLVDRATPGAPDGGLGWDAWGLYLSSPGGMLI